MSVEIKQNNIDVMLKAVRALIKKDVLVGIPDTGAERAPEPGEKAPASNALIGYVQETGDPAKNVPARPFLVPGVAEAKDEIVAQMKKGGQAALDGDFAKLDAAFNAAGFVAQKAVKLKINSNVPPPLSDKTLAARKRRGVTRTNTLVDTGQLLNSITYVIRPKKS